MGYSTREDSESEWGPDNIAAWGDADNHKDMDSIAARITWAIASVQAMIDMELRDVGYTLPFDPVPDEIKFLSSTLVGITLYEAPRGMDDEEPNKGMMRRKKDAMRTLQRIKNRVVTLNAACDAFKTPGVYKECE